MMTSYFNLLKYAATGIASPDMSYYDKMRASTLMGGVVQTLTGIPPLSFKSDGSPLISWSMIGNGSQSGTPTPDNPVMPEFVGMRTGNLWDEDYTGISGDLKYAPVYVGDGSFTLSTDAPDYSGNAPLFLLSGNVTSGASTSVNGVYNGVSRTAVSSNGYITIAFRRQSESSSPITHNTMLNSGSTVLPYEPYGWAEKITCAGQTVPVYLGQVSTVRRVKRLVLTGNEDGWREGTGFFYIQQISSDYKRSAGNITLMCTHYQPYKQVAQGGDVPNGYCSFYYDPAFQRLYIVDNSIASLADFKSYLAAQYAAGTPVTVWYVLNTPETGIVNEPLAKIGDYADELHSTDTGVTIPTVSGENTLTVDTDLMPSKIVISGGE